MLKRELGEARVKDCGLDGRQNRIAAKKVREWAAKRGYDLSSHRSAGLDALLIQWADVIVYMDGGNRRRLGSYPGALAKARCLGEWVGVDRIPDPNYLPLGAELERVLQLVVDASLALAKDVR